MYTSILFDLDGTLSESAPGITKSLQYGLTAVGIEVSHPETLTRFIGPPLNVELAAVYHLSSWQIGQVISRFRERYESVGLLECEPYPGIRELIRDCRDAGRILGVASSKPEPHVKTMLENFGIASCFHVICGSSIEDELSNTSSADNKSQIIRRAVALLRRQSQPAPSSQTVMVGDTRYDIQGARSNGLPAIGVTYGYGSRKELIEAGASHLAASAEELRSLLLSR